MMRWAPKKRRLLNAADEWIKAFETCKRVTTNGRQIRRTDPIETFAELYLRAKLTDCIAETCDGYPLDLAAYTAKQIKGLLPPSDFRRVGWLIAIR